eukprot:GFYU01037392.1.p1 GENE.GFYU01037392.1~~GFYU01037392.1.p1  ORF type:complete len:126 (+),score=7.77 GFYU01037392.1:2-379(+)
MESEMLQMGRLHQWSQRESSKDMVNLVHSHLRQLHIPELHGPSFSDSAEAVIALAAHNFTSSLIRSALTVAQADTQSGNGNRGEPPTVAVGARVLVPMHVYDAITTDPDESGGLSCLRSTDVGRS